MIDHQSAGRGAEPRVILEDMLIPSDTAGIRLFIRNKRLSSLREFSGSRTILFVHGSSYPASTSFDLPFGGRSWMDHLAGQGHDVYLLDLRGYGRSTRPTEMDLPADGGTPIVRTETAVRDVASAVRFILGRRGIDQLNLIGWSWGTTLMASFTAANNGLVNRLVLLAPQWLRTTPSLSDMGGVLGTYRLVSRADARARWLRGVPEDKRADTLPDDWFRMWADATFATDPWGATQSPQVLRVPNGTVQDSREYWAAGVPLYDPSDIRVPVLLVHAEWDQEMPLEMCRTYFSLLAGAPYRRWVEIGEGTHSLPMERNRWQLIDEVDSFLNPGGLAAGS
ncbi:alpha/beta hydrolase [Azospirillum picis]|uniref:Pimeloyl-ACP methyl ester carboxylesterase n=1 Tax=Azospirillum picis TaxID=488438 RepID=A0ABU0MJC4_9PROT|nr:alpha/beta fold hydrolase [Azospirillum picis]MBP2299766.1 pimeloyl-ACP methyl ester carboxylesterase [Azospirillum picis]MDQ0533562.1 pimeloyl-ACP methyl ester carboxylesterase [Azospirillum picis]